MARALTKGLGSLTRGVQGFARIAPVFRVRLLFTSASTTTIATSSSGPCATATSTESIAIRNAFATEMKPSTIAIIGAGSVGATVAW